MASRRDRRRERDRRLARESQPLGSPLLLMVPGAVIGASHTSLPPAMLERKKKKPDYSFVEGTPLALLSAPDERNSASVGSAGAQSISVGVRSTSSASVGGAGTRAVAVGIHAVTAAAVGRAGLRSASVGASATSAASVGRVGARSESAGNQSSLTATQGHSGARSQSVGVRAVAAVSIGTAGCTAVTPGLAGRTGVSVLRTGARSIGVGAQGGPATPIVPRCPVTVGARSYVLHARARGFNHAVPRRLLTLTVRNC